MVWMSSSVAMGGSPAPIRCPTRSSPARTVSASSAVYTPATASPRAHALERRMSCGQRRRSVPMDRLMASRSGEGPPAKRPPQSLWDPSADPAGVCDISTS